jgi:EAL domain-containing protein (putative c-di-GMP-specific phosphodiesterase class I)
MVMEEHHRAMEVLSAITELGIHTSIDDFGTGYASLSYLHQLPSRELKIDKTFVTDMVENEHNMIIVQTIIDLAHNLSMSVVAEGVESEDVLHRLLDFGCDAMQGYHISRPMEASQLGPWLHRWDDQHGLTHQVKLDLAV